jgi:hypothetical protein
MPRYLVEWELDITKVPISPQERAKAFLPMVQMVKQDMQSGLCKAWGAYIAEGKGFAVDEGGEEEVNKMAQKYIPFVRFTTHPFATIDQMEKVFKEMMK